jgi:hypothetical protein
MRPAKDIRVSNRAAGPATRPQLGALVRRTPARHRRLRSKICEARIEFLAVLDRTRSPTR